MNKEKINEKIERLKLLAEDFLNKDKRIFIKDMNNHYYFADIILVGDEGLTIQSFAPAQRKGEKTTINWLTIILMEEYREGGE